MKTRSIQSGLTASAVLALAGAAASADTLYDSQGFEASAGYTAGQYLVGQPSGGGTGQWEGGSQDASVEAEVATYSAGTASNSQYVALADEAYVASGNYYTYATAGDAGYFYPGTYHSPNNAFNPGAGSVTVSWSGAYASGAVGNPFFGIFAYGSAGVLGGFGVDASTNSFVVYAGNAYTEFTSSTSTLSTNTFGTYAMVLNYSSDSFDIYYDGTKLDTTPYTFLNPSDTYEDADLTSYSLDGSSTQFYGFGYYDNYLVTYVPEPCSMAAALGIAGTMLLRRRRRSVSQ